MTNKGNFLSVIVFLFGFYSIQSFGQNKTKVLILGTFHMAGTVDKNKVENDDILGLKRQNEVKEILGQLEKFKPTKIFVENLPENQIYWDSVYTDLRKGIYPKDDYLHKNEIFQLGLQLSQRLNLEKGCTCVDWQQPDSTNKNPVDKMLFNYSYGVGKYIQSIPNKETEKMYNEDFELLLNEFNEFYKSVPNLNLKDILLHLNSKEIQRKYFYSTLAIMERNPFKVGVFSANEQMIRNMNIFMNIVQKTEKDDKNIIIIYGAGHGEALRVMLQSHPRFEVVELNTVLK